MSILTPYLTRNSAGKDIINDPLWSCLSLLPTRGNSNANTWKSVNYRYGRNAS
jgi:hypothetical protein